MNMEFIEAITEKSLVVIPFAGEEYLAGEGFVKGSIGNSKESRFKYNTDRGIVALGYNEDSKCYFVGIDLKEKQEMNNEKLRLEYAKFISDITPEGYENIVFVIPNIKELDGAVTVQSIAEGLMLRDYEFNRHKSKNTRRTYNKYLIADSSVGTETIKEYRKGLEKAKVICNGVNFARDLVNEPVNELYPEGFVEKLLKALKDTRVKVEVLDMEALKKRGMNGVIGVGRGSPNKPYMAVLKYDSGAKLPWMALVGKGVTVDMGGVNLKSGKNLSDIRSDMAGAAHVLAVLMIISQLKMKVNVYGIIPLVENVVDGNSLRPGEIITYNNGTTVEIKNTDCEGRLILADGILLARELKAHIIIDMATLTGNVGQALGSKIAGALGNNDLVSSIIDSGKECGEKFWQMPLEEEYRKALDSDIADIGNIGMSEPGVITAALFLKEFTGDAVWAHLDIAAAAFSSNTEGYTVKGGTGFGIRSMVKFLENISLNGPAEIIPNTAVI